MIDTGLPMRRPSVLSARPALTASSARPLEFSYQKAPPPTFVVFGTRAEQLPEDYRRYLVNSLREAFGLNGAPIRLELRGTVNPYAESR